MRRPDFANIPYAPRGATTPGPQAADAWLTPEHVPVKAYYAWRDLAGMEHLQYAAGLPPFLRGPYSTMYALQPWTIRQYFLI
jgi:methylmalonyl-CoA mutase